MKILASILAASIAASVPAFGDCSITGDCCRVTFKGQAVQPSFGSVAGFWFWSCGALPAFTRYALVVVRGS